MKNSLDYLSETHFLNIDFIIDITIGMDELLEALKPVDTLNRFDTKAVLELTYQPKSAESAIRDFVALVQKLPPHVREIWDKANSIDFDIGIQSHDRSYSKSFHLSNEVLALAISVSANINFTVYSASKNQQSTINI